MSDNNIEYTKINSIEFGEGSIGQKINENFEQIDENFKQIASAEYLKGAPGHSVTITTKTLSEGSDEMEDFVNCIIGKKYQHRKEDITRQLKGCKVTIINGIIDGKETQLSSFPFGFKDTEYKTQNLDDPENYSDLSCIIYYNYNTRKYENLQMFPSLYYDDVEKNFCWMVNGNRTGLVARGPQGSKGKTGVGEKGDTGEKGEKGDTGETGSSGKDGLSMLIASYKDTETDNIKNITKFYYKSQNNWDWISTNTINNSTNIPLIENSIVLACKDTDNENKEWCWGLLHIESITEYKLIYGGLLSNVIGSAGMNLLELMKYNKYLFIPTTEDKQSGHLITGDPNILKIGYGSSKGSIEGKTDSKFESEYDENVFKGKVTIEGELNAGNLNLVATGAKRIIDDNDYAYKEGSSSKPVYFSNGVPMVCTTVAGAEKLSETFDSDGISMGNSSTPVYFKDGVPVECDNIVSGNAETSRKLVELVSVEGDELKDELTPLAIGNSSKPVYFEEGVPVVCGGELDVDITGHADSANHADSAESATYANRAGQSNYSDESGTAGYADLAGVSNTLGNDKNKLYNIGDENSPVYFANGVPVECGKMLDVNITGESSYSESTGKLKNPVNISIHDGAIGTPTSFDGSQDISIPITELNENYLVWSDNTSKTHKITPVDFAVNNYLNSNRLSFISSDNILVEYSRDEGNKWKSYDLSNEEKTSLVTTGLSKKLYLGSVQNQTTSLDRLRITINAPSNNLYCSAKKLLFHTIQKYVKDYKVELQILYVGIYNTEKDIENHYVTKQIYDITGEDGWYSIPLNFEFGGSNANIDNIRSIRILFYFKGEESGTNPCSCMIDDIALHGELINDFGHPLAKTNNICSWDAFGNAIFENNLIVKENIYADAIEIRDIALNKAVVNTLKQESSISSIGEENNYWPNAFIDDIESNYIGSIKTDIKFADIKTANIETANISNINNDNISIQNDLPIDNYPFTSELKYELSNNEVYIMLGKQYEGIDPMGGVNMSHDENFGEIIIKTSQLDSIENDTLDIKIPNLYIPIGITYINDYYTNLVGTKKWANINLSNIVATMEISGVEKVGDSNTFKTYVEFPNYTLPLNENYQVRKRNGVIYYAFNPEVIIKNVKLKLTDNGYEDCKIRLVNLNYTLDRDIKGVYKKGDGIRVNYVYVHGLYISNKDIDNGWYPEQFNTDKPLKMSIIITNDLTDKGNIYCNYFANKEHNKIYFSKNGILMVNGYSKLKIIPPKNYKGSGKIEDSFGYIEVYQYNEKYPEKSITKRKSLYDLLN